MDVRNGGYESKTHTVIACYLAGWFATVAPSLSFIINSID
jgi:hypothetical protein